MNENVDMLAKGLGCDTPVLLYMPFYKGKSVIDLCEMKGGEEISVLGLHLFFSEHSPKKYHVSMNKFLFLLGESSKFEMLDNDNIKMIK